MGEKMRPVHAAVERYVQKNERFTVEDVRKNTKKGRKEVRAAINRLIDLGRVERVCTKRAIVKGKMSRGRPEVIYQRR